jgi:hypothetical protein
MTPKDRLVKIKEIKPVFDIFGYPTRSYSPDEVVEKLNEVIRFINKIPSRPKRSK